jgi:hypothetical protein
MKRADTMFLKPIISSAKLLMGAVLIIMRLKAIEFLKNGVNF